MRKLFSCATYCVFVLIALFFCDSWTFLIFLCVLIFVLWIVYAFLTDPLKRDTVRKPGTVSHSKCYITKHKVTKTVDSCTTSKSDRFKGNLNDSTKSFFKAPVRKERSVYFKSYSPYEKSCQTSMSYLRSSPSSSSIGLFDSSPVRRRPLHSRNSLERNEDNACVSPVVRTPVREVASDVTPRGDVTPRSAIVSDSGSPNGNMSVGEFPLISLISSLHEAVSPKTPRLKPSPVTIRIQPIQSPDTVSENRVDPVVSVLKQLASKKRVLAPTVGPLAEDEHRGKRSRSMPRHDLTHSLLESQLTINCGRETGVGSKREREESHCLVSSPNGTVSSGTAPKRMCARTLRSNEILSSLSSSITIVSPTSSKSYTGKRKNITYDKYKKMRKLEESLKQMKYETESPSKVDKAVTAKEPPVKKSPPLPVITIKRDEIAERVVSRAMVSALLKSTVSKLIMSGDPAVYPVPNGTQPRQPEVSTPQFGPPRSEPPPPKPIVTTAAPSTGALGVAGVASPPSSTFSFGLQTPKSASVPSPVVVNSTQPSSGAMPTTQTVTSSVQSPSTTTPAASVQTSFSLTKPQMSTSSVPSFGLGVSSASLVPTTSSSSSLQLGGVSTSSPSVPTFGLPITTSALTSPDTSLSQATVVPAVKTPSFGLTTSTPNPLLKTSTPTFGLATSATTTSIAPAVPSFSFGNPSVAKTANSTAPPPSFSSIIANSTAPSFSLTTSTVTTPSGNIFSSNTTTAPPVFGSTVTTPAVTSKPLFGAVTSSAAITTPSTVVSTAPSFIPSLMTSNPPAFGTVTTSTSSNPIFGASLVTKPLFGTGVTTFGAPANSTTSSTNMFGSTVQPTTATAVFGTTTTTVTTSTPLFGTTTVTTSSTPAFGSFTAVNPVTASNSIFGSVNSTQSSSAPIFGGAITSTANPLFGPATTTTASTPFGSTTVATPLFGPAKTAPPLFGASTSATNTSTPLFTATSVSTATTAPIFGSTSTSFSTASGFGAPSTPAASEGLFGMPPASTGFKTTSPFQVGGGDAASTATGFGGSASQPKPFEFGTAKAATGGFTFKTSSSTPTPFTTQPPPSTSFSTQPPSQTSFSFTGAGSTTTAGQSGGSPFVFGSAGSATTTSSTVAGVKPFQFGPTPAAPVAPAFGATQTPVSTPAFGQTFASGFGQPPQTVQTPAFGQPQPPSGQAPAFGQSPASAQTPVFGQPATSPAPGAFQFSATQPPPPPGATGGLFSIGTGSSGSRLRDRRDRRRRV